MENVTHPCRWCGQQVYSVDKISTGGWLCILFGLLLSPVLIGIPLFFLGFFIKDSFVACDNCGRQ